MDKHLRPSRFETEPNALNAEKAWKHWYRTFCNFLNSLPKTAARTGTANTGTDDGGIAAQRTPEEVEAENQTNKLNLLTNYISENIFDYIIEAETFDAAVATLENLYVKPRSIIFNRHQLATTKQSHGESIDQFMQTLEKLSKNCEFKEVTGEQYRQEYIRDAFINGLSSSSIRQRLLENNDITLSEAFKQARTLESAEKHSADYATSEPLASILEPDEESTDEVVAATWKGGDGENSSEKCWHCNRPRHPRAQCPAKDSICQGCGIKGHWFEACMKNKNKQIKKKKKGTSAAMFKVPHPMLAATQNSKSTKTRDITYTMSKIQEKKVHTMIDSGSKGSFIGKKTAKRLDLLILPTSDPISLADNSRVDTIGEVVIDITLNGKLYKGLVLSVMNKLVTEVILGTDFLRRHKKVTFEFDGPEEPITFAATRVAAPKTTNNEKIRETGSSESHTTITEQKSTMNVPPVKLFSNLSADCKPIACKSRRYSDINRKFIQKEIETWLAEGTIVPSQSPWRAQPIVTTDDENHRKRMAIDYSLTINLHTELDAYPMPNIQEHVETVAQYKVFSTYDLKTAYHQIPIPLEDRKYTAFEAHGGLYEFTVIPNGVTNGVPAFQRVMDRILKDEGLDQTYAFVDNVTICGNNQEDHDKQEELFLKVAKKYNIRFNDKKTVKSKAKIALLGYIIENGILKPDPQRLKPLVEIPPPQNLTEQRRLVGMFAYYSKWINNFSDKIRLLNKNTTFPLSAEVFKSFEQLKDDIVHASVANIDPNIPFVVETDASDYAIAATLNQNGRPVAFFSRTLRSSEIHYHPVEKEACAIVESLLSWKHYLVGRQFKLITDQRSVAFMYNNRRRTKIKNDKIARWRVDLSCYRYDVVYRPGKENVGADALSRVKHCSVISNHSLSYLKELHEALCHPGITRTNHFVKTRNLAFSINDIKKVTETCPTCLKIKPQFIKSSGNLIKATQPFQQLNIDFKGPLPVSENKNRYLLTVIDEYSRFPFAFPCRDMTSRTVTQCFDQLFSLFGMPGYVHSDRARDFLSAEVKEYLNSKGIASSRTSRYNPRGNGQTERYNGVIWKNIQLALDSRKLPVGAWESVLPDALHSIRSLLCTSTNATPHERMFQYNRKSTAGNSVPSWLTPAPIYVRKHVRNSKYEPIVERAELLHVNPQYAFVKLSNGHETTVSLRDVAPCDRTHEPRSTIPELGEGEMAVRNHVINDSHQNDKQQLIESSNDNIPTTEHSTQHEALHQPKPVEATEPSQSTSNQNTVVNQGPVRRSKRIGKPRDLFADSNYSSI